MEGPLLVAPPPTPKPPTPFREALQALTFLNQNTLLLDYANVVVRRDYAELSTVKLLSGGIGGSDLFHAQFVGKGMLTAAILGDGCAPNSRQISHVIRELHEGSRSGILVVAQSNADLFNFVLAAHRDNYDCETRVTVLTIDEQKCTQKERYSCGFILLCKILGAMADKGLPFTDLCKFFHDNGGLIVTVPLTFTTKKSSSRLQVMEDYDLHIKNFIAEKINEDEEHFHFSVPIVALINFSTNMRKSNQLLIIKHIIETLKHAGVCIMRLYFGNFLSQSHQEASLTVMKLYDLNVLQHLDAECDAPGWQRVNQYLPEIGVVEEIPGLLKNKGKQAYPRKGPILGESQCKILTKALQFACDALISCERQLNIIDEEKSSGNVGSRLSKMATEINQRLSSNKLPIDCPHVFFKKLSVIAEATIEGTMGSIYGILFNTAAKYFEKLTEAEVVTPTVWIKGFAVVCLKIDRYCPKDLKETSLVYPLKCSQMIISNATEENFLQCYEAAVGEAEEAAQRTKSEDCRYADAGAHAVGIWMRAIFECVKLLAI